MKSEFDVRSSKLAGGRFILPCFRGMGWRYQITTFLITTTFTMGMSYPIAVPISTPLLRFDGVLGVVGGPDDP